MAALNYATQYSAALANAYPYALYFGDLYNVENDTRYKWKGADTIAIPALTTTGRTAGNKDAISAAKRNYNNSWELKKLTNHREWSTLVHPDDIDSTNQVATITNITQTFNETQKFPEMDCYLISKIYADWTGQSMTADTTALTPENILQKFDEMMEKMTNKRVPKHGRILYTTPENNTKIKNAKTIARTIMNGDSNLNRLVDSIDTVKIVEVPSDIMQTTFNFTEGVQPGTSPKQIHMMLVHPSAIITPVKYQYSGLDDPSPKTSGKYLYFEESIEDVFILNNKKDAIDFVISA